MFTTKTFVVKPHQGWKEKLVQSQKTEHLLHMVRYKGESEGILEEIWEAMAEVLLADKILV